jgi:threonyl-tRNA synthetase
VFTPHIGKLDLYRRSGHFPYYADSQYPPFVERETLAAMATEGVSCADLTNRLQTGEIDGYLLKPMNCPHHIRIFASQRHSYRDLPIRLAEFGTVYRWEQSGELNGMVRVRGLTQDDAHIFCTEEQLSQELSGCLALVKIILQTLDMKDYRVRVGLRDPDSTKYVGQSEVWDKAEQACRQAAATLGVPFTTEPGEAAFYGPKIDFVVKDVLGREWQLGTIQVDYNLPERFDLGYVGSDNQLHRPVIIHRAPFGSMERFCGVLIEHFAGAFPTWLAPVQAVVLPISEKHHEYARQLAATLLGENIRVKVDDRNEKIGLKIREAQLQKVPYMLVVGDKEAAGGSVSLRTRKQGDQGSLSREDVVRRIRDDIETRRAEA